jgi:glucosylceramidase
MSNINSKNDNRYLFLYIKEIGHTFPIPIQMFMILSLLIFLFETHIYAQKIELVSTTENDLWKSENLLTLGKSSDATTITIHPEVKEQSIIGFGGCFNEAGWEALKLIPASEQNEVFSKLFSLQGANFNYNRFPIGASDYANDFYSFD